MGQRIDDWFLDEAGEEDEPAPPNQLAVAPLEQEALQEAKTLLPPSALNVSGRIPKGSTWKVSCGLCRSCLFSPAQVRCALSVQ